MSLTLRIISLIMCIFTSISNLIYAKNPTENDFKYSSFDQTEKKPFENTEYIFGENDILVSPEGNDDNNGSESAPLKTIEAAKALAVIKRNSGITDKITVWIKGGDYYLNNSLVFDKNDAENVSYIAIPNEKVNIKGSEKITGWKEDTANGQKCVSADIGKGKNVTAIINGESKITQTRYPESGYFYISKTDHNNSLFNDDNTPWSLTHGDKELSPDKNQTIKEFRNSESVTLRVFHYWCNDMSYIKGYDSKNNRIFLTVPLSMDAEKGNKYYFENVYEALDKPGEWYYDTSEGKIYYILKDGETAENLNLEAAVNDKLIEIKECNNLYFEGITFCNTTSTFPNLKEDGLWLSEYGMRHPQAEVECGATVEITSAKGISFAGCNFKNVGLGGIKFRQKVKNSSVKSCNFTNIGATAVFINGLNSENDSEITENITVTDNLINGYGKYFYSAIGVLITHARNCEISNNEITDGYYSAVSVGWVWGYAYSVTKNIKIRDNLIYNIGQGWLSDMGGIYTLGNQPGTEITGNVIYNVAADKDEGGYGGWGIYLDEGSADILVSKNLVYDCGSQGFHQHYGENNIIINNIFALNDEGQLCSSFSHASGQLGYADEKTHNEFTVKGNILLSDNTPIYAKAGNHTFKDDSNIYWDLTNRNNVFSAYYDTCDTFTKIWAKNMKKYGLFTNAIYADPGFKDARNFDFTLPDNNDALNKIGFEKWDYSQAGTITQR